MGKFIAGIVTCLVLGAIAALAISYSGVIAVGADSPVNPALGWFVHNTFLHSVQSGAKGIVVPANLETPANVQAGAKLYAIECVYCHGGPGVDETAMAKGMDPSPPNILGAKRSNTPAPTFWIVKHGVQMSGMPAWGKSYKDQDLWNVVAFLHAKKGLSADEYKKLTAEEGG